MPSRDIRQSALYAQYMESSGWKVEPFGKAQGKRGKWYAYIRQFLLIGSFIKIQRIRPQIPFKEIEQLRKKYRGFRVVIELGNEASKGRTPSTKLRVRPYSRTNSPHAPSKTIHIDLITSENEIFQRFSEAKRRAVRRAIKNNIVVQESDDIEEFIRLKIKQDFLFGFLLKKDLITLWRVFGPKNSVVLLAYRRRSNHSNDTYHHSKSNDPTAGILLLFSDDVAYYWQAAATKEGKKLFAPTLLVWEALKLSKKRGCKVFDFEGVYDERFPKATENWRGFTKFKEGFGGREVYYPPPLVK